MTETTEQSEFGPEPGEPQKIPMKPVDLNAVLADLREVSDRNFDGLNKPILAIAPSAIAATIAFVGATVNSIVIGNVQSWFLLAALMFWLLSIITILITYLLKGFAVDKALHWAKQFEQLDFESASLAKIEYSVLRNRNIFDANSKMMKWARRLQIVSPIVFSLGFFLMFCFLVATFLFKS